MTHSRGRAFMLTAALMGGAMATPAWADGERIEDRLEELELLLKEQQDQLRVLREEQQRLQATQVAAETAGKEAPKDEGASENAIEFGKTTVKFGGYIKLDVIASSFSDGELPSSSLGRDFYIPSLIPVIPDAAGFEEGDDIDLDFNPRETRFLIDANTPFENGVNLRGYFEIDFQVTNDGDERVSNTFPPRIRRGFIEVDGLTPGTWLVGQEWSTFHDVSVLPDGVDFIGPTEGTVFNRQPMIRYSIGNWQLALEQPETAVTPFGGGARLLPGDDRVPDFAARYTFDGDWGYVRLQGILRELRAENIGSLGDGTASTVGYGASLSGKMPVFDTGNVIRFMVTAGDGIGRYVGVNIINDVVDDGMGDLEARGLFSGFFSYQHFWSDQWRSNVTLSGFKAFDDTDLTGLTETRDVRSIRSSLIYSPVPKLDLGFEATWASRTIENGNSGELFRTQFAMKYKL
ncbi:MAG: DcaP family trimeric outer membrane transporter [Alphaproteobacteria bacterium]